MVWPLWKTIWLFCKKVGLGSNILIGSWNIKTYSYHTIQQFHSVSIFLRQMKIYIHTRTYMPKYIVDFHNYQKLETNCQMSLSHRMDKQSAKHPYNGILLRNKKERTRICTTWARLKCIMLTNRSQTQKATQYDSIYMTF